MNVTKIKTLGIIVPIYNTQIELVEKALNSIIDITKYTDDIDVIIVDNGSNGEDIWNFLVKNYKSYPFITLKRFEINEGKRQATSYGFKNINSKYIQVLDSDDWLDSEKTSNVIDILKNVEADMLFLKYYYYDNKKNYIRKERKMNRYVKYPYKKLDQVPRFLWHFDTNTILNRDFLIKNNFAFPENKIYYEDIYINMWSLSKAKNIYYINESIYYYRVNLDGNNLSSIRMLSENLQFYENMVKELVKLDYSNPITSKNMIHLFALQYLSLCYFWINNNSFITANFLINNLKLNIKENEFLYKAKGMKRPNVTSFGDILLWKGYSAFFIKPISNIVLKFKD